MFNIKFVTSREGRVSRNIPFSACCDYTIVTSREGRVSRNAKGTGTNLIVTVTSREGRVSRNVALVAVVTISSRHVPRGTCE